MIAAYNVDDALQCAICAAAFGVCIISVPALFVFPLLPDVLMAVIIIIISFVGSSSHSNIY